MSANSASSRRSFGEWFSWYQFFAGVLTFSVLGCVWWFETAGVLNFGLKEWMMVALTLTTFINSRAVKHNPGPKTTRSSPKDHEDGDSSVSLDDVTETAAPPVVVVLVSVPLVVDAIIDDAV